MEQEKIRTIMNEQVQLGRTKQQVLDREAELKAQLLEIMQQQKINVLKNVHIRVNYVAGFSRNSVDSEKLKEKYPDAAKDCIRTTVVPPFVKVTVK